MIKHTPLIAQWKSPHFDPHWPNWSSIYVGARVFMISHQTRSGVDASLCFALENLFAQPAVFCTVRKMEMKLLCYVCARIRIATLNPTTPLINHWWNNWHDIKKVSKDRYNEFLSITKRVGIISYGALLYTFKKSISMNKNLYIAWYSRGVWNRYAH